MLCLLRSFLALRVKHCPSSPRARRPHGRGSPKQGGPIGTSSSFSPFWPSSPAPSPRRAAEEDTGPGRSRNHLQPERTTYRQGKRHHGGTHAAAAGTRTLSSTAPPSTGSPAQPTTQRPAAEVDARPRPPPCRKPGVAQPYPAAGTAPERRHRAWRPAHRRKLHDHVPRQAQRGNGETGRNNQHHPSAKASRHLGPTPGPRDASICSGNTVGNALPRATVVGRGSSSAD